MDPHIAILFLVAVFAGAAALSWYNAEAQVVRRLLLAAPRVTIAAFPVGTSARVVGTVAPLAAVTTPIGGVPCVFFECVVEEYRSSGKSGTWHRVARESRSVPFLVTDGTGRALVDPTFARVSLDLDEESQSGTFDDPSPSESAFLARHRVEGATWIGTNKRLRFREFVIAAGDVVAVAGVGARELDPDAGTSGEGYRDVPMRLALRGTSEAPLLVSDRPDTLA